MNQSNASDKFAPYYAAVRYLEGLGNISGGYQKTDLKSHPRPEMYLERMQDFLDLIGNPEKGFKYIHITGTAGKGSVSAAVHAALIGAGKRAGLFTSPFTVSTIEKIQVGKLYIDPLVFADITERLKPFIDESLVKGRHGAPSYFELMLAIALLYFKREKCEFVVLEVGLGGRYDATNIIENPLITAITNIALDHTNILGHCREDIARDKSGIIKKNSFFFTTEESRDLLEIFRNECAKVKAECHILPVKGLDYRARNRLLAGSICTALNIIKTPEDIRPMPKLPARFEIIETKPDIIIDGAHNPSKIDSTIFNLSQREYGRLFLIIAISADKDWRVMVRKIGPLADHIYVTRFNMLGRQSVSPDVMMHEAKKYAKKSSKIRVYSDPIQAFADAKRQLKAKDLLLVTGSFYLSGDIRSLYYPEKHILRARKSW